MLPWLAFLGNIVYNTVNAVEKNPMNSFRPGGIANQEEPGASRPPAFSAVQENPGIPATFPEERMTAMKMGRNLFVAVTALLVIIIVAISAMTLAQGPRTSSVELIRRSGSTADVNDLYEGNTTIPFYEIPQNTYKPDDFTEDNGMIEYVGPEKTYVGINVNEKKGDIDWEQVKNTVDYAMIRVGHREYMRGRIIADSKFEQNIKGATDAGIPVGVYFYSQAVSDAEAEAEASFVLEHIRNYSMTYPVAIYWEYKLKEDGSQDENSRTVRCNGDQVTGFIDAFCGKIKNAGYTPCYYADKAMAYNRLDLSRLSNYDLWYAEYRPAPSFFYDFKIWQYTKEGEVPGISEKVPINISFKTYKN